MNNILIKRSCLCPSIHTYCACFAVNICRQTRNKFSKAYHFLSNRNDTRDGHLHLKKMHIQVQERNCSWRNISTVIPIHRKGQAKESRRQHQHNFVNRHSSPLPPVKIKTATSDVLFDLPCTGRTMILYQSMEPLYRNVLPMS
jgi:hypothetical protein